MAATQAGERLLRTAGPRLDEVEAELASLTELREKPAGTIRITTSDHAANAILIPKLGRMLPDYPDIKVDIIVDYGLTDIVASRYDAGVRLGEQVARGMIAVPIGPEMRMAAVASPSYFAKHAPPNKPQDLTNHCCIVLDHVRAGRLVRVMEDWTPPFPGYHLYYTTRRQPSAAFSIVIAALRARR
ncbi:MAG TPA: LysR substrate-binding domain-containing protein [Kofleriaceae bacterium]|nr:LysR substrate-binding domain-containing protein [Kofleriaceae bacterium]